VLRKGETGTGEIKVIVTMWKAVMDPEHNALMRLPKTVRFQLIVVLASLWSVIFCVSAGLIVWLPGYVLVHVVLLLIGIFGTGWIFSGAQRSYLK
jgi:hypothetical protein